MSSYSHAGGGASGVGVGVGVGSASSASSASSSGGASSGGFPLRANFFRSLPLSKETAAALYGAAKQNAAACLHQSFNEQWRYVPPEKDGTQLRKDTSNLATSCRFVRAATVLRCQEHEMNMVISNTNTDSWREFMRKCFGKHYIDTMILHSFAGPGKEAAAKDAADNTRAHRAASDRPTLWLPAGHKPPSQRDAAVDGVGCGDSDAADDAPPPAAAAMKRRHSDTRSEPSDDETHSTLTTNGGDDAAPSPAEPAQELLTVKWGAFDTGGQGKRDLCVLDYLTTTTLPGGDSDERVYMWCFSSVEGERVGCMALKDTHGIARATLSKLGVFWRRLGDDETEVIVCGSFASKHAKYASAIFLQSLNRLQGIVEDLRLSNQIYIHRSTWVKDHERSSCHLCMRNFYALRRKHHCRKCGEVICSDCSVVENVDLPVIGSSKLRLCKVCCLKAKSTPLKRHDRANVFDHLVRARSLSDAHAPPEPSPYHARMSFADSGSGSGGSSGGERERSDRHAYHHPHHHQYHHHHHHHAPSSFQPTPPGSHHQYHHAPSAFQPSGTRSTSSTSQQHQQAVAQAVSAARAELFVEASSRSSSSFSSSNTNDFELTDSLEDYVTVQQQHPPFQHQPQQAQSQQSQSPSPSPSPSPSQSQSQSQSSSSSSSAAAVHPVGSKDLRGAATATAAATASSSTASSTPMLATAPHDDEYDDFIDVRTLNKQLYAMEQRQKQIGHAAATSSGSSSSPSASDARPANSNMFDLLCELACQTLACPIASVSIVDATTGESIRSASGLADKPELSDELALFLDKVMGSTPTIVLDANVDKQVASLFTKRGAPQIRFFAGCPIHSRAGKKLGYVCVADFTKRDTLGASCAFTMERLATLAVTTMERNLAAAKQPPPPQQPQQPEAPYAAGSYGANGAKGYGLAGPTSSASSNQTSHHPAAIFDRPTSDTAPPPRHRQSNATHPGTGMPQPTVSHLHYQPPPQYHSAAQAYQYQDAYPPAHTARVYDLSAEPDVPVLVGSPVGAYSAAARHGPPPPPPYHAPSPPAVAPLPRQYNEYSAGYYEAQERMRKLLIKSYHTSQQLATGATPMAPPPQQTTAMGGAPAYHAQY